MVLFWDPSDEDRAEIERRLPPECEEDPALEDNHRFAAYWNLDDGLYAKGKRPANIWWRDADGALQRYKTTLSRREWIERFVRILDLDKKIVPLRYRSGQRRMEALILRMERAGVPVRIVCLKSRKHGVSTQAVALGLHESMRRKNRETLIVGDTDERAEMILRMTTVARLNMPKKDGKWGFKMASKAAHQIRWAEPINSLFEIASAKREDPGIGGTPTIIHGTEVATWEDAGGKAAALLNGLPSRPGTMAFMESTARGAWGLFHDTFWAADEEKDLPFKQRATSWAALFIPWFEHEECRWSKTFGDGQPPPPDQIERLETSLDADERWALEQTYIRRWQPDDEWRQREDGRWYRVGVGRVKVDYDQIAWYRRKLKDPECMNNRTLRNREFPGRPDVAFQASGNPVFDPEEITRRMQDVRDPIWRGTLLKAS